MTKEEWFKIRCENSELNVLIDREINRILRTDDIGNGINYCQSQEEVISFIEKRIIPWINLETIKKELS